jgi:hypothetical protein
MPQRRLTTTDASTFLQNKIDAAITNMRGGTVDIPADDYELKRPLRVPHTRGLVIRGSSQFASVLHIHFGEEHATRAVLECTNSTNVVVEHLGVICESRVECAIRLARDNPAKGIPTMSNHTYRHMNIELNGRAQYGVRIGGGDDQNNEHHTFDKIDVKGFTESAFRQEGLQSKAVTYRDCRWEGRHAGRFGIDTRGGGSLRAYGCKGGQVMEADYMLGRPVDNILIEGFDHEGSRRLVTTTGPSATPWVVSVRDGRWDTEYLADDGWFVVFLDAGPLALERLMITTHGRPTRVLHFSYAPYRTLIAEIDLDVREDQMKSFLEVNDYVTGSVEIRGIQCRTKEGNARQRPDFDRSGHFLGTKDASRKLIGPYRASGENPPR